MADEKLTEKVGRAIAMIRLAADISEAYYKKPLRIAYSGGKDSDVLADLAVRSGAGVEFSNNHTSVDAPETVYHIRRVFERLRASGYEARVQYPRDETADYDVEADRRKRLSADEACTLLLRGTERGRRQ